MDAATEKQMMDAWRDRLRQGESVSWPDFKREMVGGYDPGLLGRVEEMGYNALSGLANIAGAPLRAAAAPGGPGVGQAPPGDSRFPQGLQQSPAVASPSPYVRPDQVEQLGRLTPDAIKSLQDIVAQGGPDAEEAQHILDARAKLGFQ